MNLQGSIRIREGEPRQDPDPRLSQLVQMRKTVNSSELNELLLARSEMNARIDQILKQHEVDARKKLEEDFEAAKAAVREQLQLIENTKSKIAGVEREIYRLDTLLAKYESAVAIAKEQRSELGPYAAKKEAQAAEQAIESAEAKCEEVIAQLGPIKSQLQHLTLVVWPSLGIELQRRTSEERRLRSAVEGEQNYQDMDGLILPAGAKF